jgi:hypothetical protein
VGTSMSNDRRSATLIFDVFVASAGPGVPADRQTRDCRIRLDLDGPLGRCDARGLTSFQYRGYEQLPAGASVMLSAQVGNGTGRSPAETLHAATGPISRDYLAIDEVRTSRLMGASVLTVNLALVGTGGSNAQATVDSIDIKVGAGPGCA